MTLRVGIIATALAVLVAGPAGSQVRQPPRFDFDAVPGQVVVQFQPQTAGAAPFNLADFLTERAEVVDELSRLGGIVLDVPSARADPAVRQAVVDRLRANPAVRHAEPNYIYYADRVPSDPLVKDMWFLERIGAYDAQDRKGAGYAPVVAVIDTGIYVHHEDLGQHVWTNPREIPDNGIDDDGNGLVDDVRGWNFVQGNNSPTAEFVAAAGCEPDPAKRLYEAHGTHVAGVIGALGDNGKGIAGLAPDVRIMALKVMGGPCGSGTTSTIIQAVRYAIDNGADIINMSLGGPHPSDILRDLLRQANDRGILVVVAAGNAASDNDATPVYPAAFDLPGLIAVAATDANDRLATFSNRGARSVHLAAPGVGILSSVPMGDTPTGPNSNYAQLSGTSMAAPMVSGALAAMIGLNPTLPRLEIMRILLATVDPVPALAGMVATGARVNLGKALAAMPAVSPPVAAPKPPIAAPEPPAVTPQPPAAAPEPAPPASAPKPALPVVTPPRKPMPAKPAPPVAGPRVVPPAPAPVRDVRGIIINPPPTTAQPPAGDGATPSLESEGINVSPPPPQGARTSP